MGKHTQLRCPKGHKFTHYVYSKSQRVECPECARERRTNWHPGINEETSSTFFAGDGGYDIVPSTYEDSSYSGGGGSFGGGGASGSWSDSSSSDSGSSSD